MSGWLNDTGDLGHDDGDDDDDGEPVQEGNDPETPGVNDDASKGNSLR